MMEPCFVPNFHENIDCMFYSRVSENGLPKILENPEYSTFSFLLYPLVIPLHPLPVFIVIQYL